MSIQLKRSYTSNLDTSYVLKQGQIGIEMPTIFNRSPKNSYRLKIGDGLTPWSDIPYVAPSDWLLGSLMYSDTVPYNLYQPSGHPNDRPYIAFHASSTAQNSGYIDASNRGLLLNAGSAGGINFSGYYELGSTSGWSWFIRIGQDWNNRNNLALHPYMKDKISLGISVYPFTSVYATNGTIQTSARSSKTNIHYLSSGKLSLVDDAGKPYESIDLSDVIEFINQLEPATFDYNYDTDEVPQENRQLGLIADDIVDTTLFKYVGCNKVDQKESDDISSSKLESLSLKPLPLTIAALTCCKYLLQQIDVLQDQIDSVSK